MKKSLEQLLFDLTEKLEYDDLDQDDRDLIEEEIDTLEDSLVVYCLSHSPEHRVILP